MLRYIFSFILLFFCSLTFAQDVQKIQNVEVLDLKTLTKQSDSIVKAKKKAMVYQGAYINVDIFNPIATAFNGGRFEFEVSADVSLWQRLFPAVEFGFMVYDHKYEDYSYAANGFFTRLGFNYNFLNFSTDRKYDHIFYAGMRYAYSNVNYHMYDAKISNDYWGEQGIYDAGKKNASVGWVEFVAGVRVQIYKSLFMGLMLHVKTFKHYYANYASTPAYIPGFGRDGTDPTNFGLSYTISYQFPYKK